LGADHLTRNLFKGLNKMKMIIIGGVLTAALLIAVLTSIRADAPHWVAGGIVADGPTAPAPAHGSDV